MNKLCGGCALKFGNVDKLKGHRREEHKWGFNRLGYCAFCGRGFDNKFSFFDHLLMDHANRWKEMDEKLDEKRGIGAQDLPVQMILAETAYRENRESYKVITVNQMIEEFGAQIDGLVNGGSQNGGRAVEEVVENREEEEVVVDGGGRDVIGAGYDSDDSGCGLRIVEDDEEEENAVEMAGQAGEELIGPLSTSTHAAPATASLIGSWLEDVTSGKLVLGQLASPNGEATLSGVMLAEAHPDDELIDVTTVSSPLRETIGNGAAIEMGTPAPMATGPTPLQITIGGDAAQLAEAARPTDLAMRAEDETATSMTSLHLDTSSLLGPIDHVNAAPRPGASLPPPGAALPTTPSALLTPPADAIATRLPMRDLLRDLTSRGRPSALTVVTGATPARLNAVDAEATRKRSLLSQATPPSTPLANGGSGEETAKKKPRSECEEHFERFHLAAMLSPTQTERRRSPSVEIIESSSVVSKRDMPKKEEAVDPQPFVIDPIMYDISDETLNAMMTPEDVESIKREVWGVVDLEQPLPHSPTDYTPLNAWTEWQRPPQAVVQDALMLTPDSSHHSGSGARFDEDQKSKRESTSPAPSSSASMISGVSNEDFLRAMMADPRAQAALADTAAKFQLNAQPLTTASQPPGSSVLARLLQPEPVDQPMYHIQTQQQQQQQQQLWAAEKAKADAMRHQQRTLQLMQPQQQGMVSMHQELSLKEALCQQQQVEMQQHQSSQQTHQPASILPSYQQATMQQAQSLQQARQQEISMSQPLSMQQLPQQQQRVQSPQHHSHSSQQSQQRVMNQSLSMQQHPGQQEQVHSLHAQIVRQAHLMGMPMSQSNQQQLQAQQVQYRQQPQHTGLPKNQMTSVQQVLSQSQQPVHQHQQVQAQQVPSQQHLQQIQPQQDRWLGGQPRASRPQLAVQPMTQPHVQYWQGAPLPPQQPAWLPALLPQQQQQNAPLTAGQLTKLQIWTASEAVCFAFRNTEAPAACPLCGMVVSGKCAAKRNHILKYHYNMHYYWKNNREAGQMQRVLENHVGAYLGTYSNPRICLACRKVEFNTREPILDHIKTCAPVQYDIFLREYIEIKTLVGTVLDRAIDAVIERLIGA